MNKRHMVSRPATMGVRTGTLRDVLKEHAQERCEHYFKYLFSMKSLVDRLNASHSLGWKYLDCVDLNATDQFGDGDRSTDADVYKFFTKMKKDESILDAYATDFAREDAAHFNNLGINPAKRAIIAQHASPAKDAVAHKLFEILKTACGNTRQLPASVNTGADKIVDNVHKRMVQKHLAGDGPVVTEPHVNDYITDAKRVMTEAMNRHASKGNKGVAACRSRYIAFYDDAAAVEKAYNRSRDLVYYECHALKLDPKDYYSPMVF